MHQPIRPRLRRRRRIPAKTHILTATVITATAMARRRPKPVATATSRTSAAIRPRRPRPSARSSRSAPRTRWRRCPSVPAGACAPTRSRK
jgi:hypothetical protein